MIEIIINGTGDLQRAARVFLEKAGESRIIAFYGQMGAGKTHLSPHMPSIGGAGHSQQSYFHHCQ